MLSKMVTAVLCAAAVAGCGASEEDEIADVVREYNRAASDGNAEKACALTADEMWAGGPSCEDIVEINALPDRRDARKRLAEGEYDVTIEGDTAIAEAQNLGTFRLRKVGGDWKLIDAR